ncbi:MAG: FHA domain-containing protein [Phycisphaerae bacterium]|nr:FHA domain-containing protein [Phycisphaerae bacterium]
MRYELYAVDPISPTAPLQVDDRPLLIGSGADCDLKVAQDDYASARHARLVLCDSTLFIEDLASANGTSVRVQRPMALEDGDEIVIGLSVFRVVRNDLTNIAAESRRAVDR